MKAINFGCGVSVVSTWQNYDASPTLRLQRLPVVGNLARTFAHPRFPDEAFFGDIVRGLPEPDGIADWIYCSHVLEHLSLDELRMALREVVRVLRPGGVFRGVLPDLEAEVRTYLINTEDDACSRFMECTSLGLTTRPRRLFGFLRSYFGNSQHLWMWDFKGLSAELRDAGFENIRRAKFGDSSHKIFESVEDAARWRGCLGFECDKPRLDR